MANTKRIAFSFGGGRSFFLPVEPNSDLLEIFGIFEILVFLEIFGHFPDLEFFKISYKYIYF